MRAVQGIAIVALAAWLGSALAACVTGPNCHCPPARQIDPAVMTIKRSVARPELVGGEVDVRADRVTIRYAVDGQPRELVFAPKPW